MKLYCILSILISFMTYSLSFAEEEPGDRVWYKVDEDSNVNSIYVDYTSIDRKEKIVKFEQMEFLLDKQKLEGTDKEYKFIVSKRKADCKNKTYMIEEEKYYDVKIDEEKDKIKDEAVLKNKIDDNDRVWVEVIPGSLVEKVWRFVCLYKPQEKEQ